MFSHIQVLFFRNFDSLISSVFWLCKYWINKLRNVVLARVYAPKSSWLPVAFQENVISFIYLLDIVFLSKYVKCINKQIPRSIIHWI